MKRDMDLCRKILLAIEGDRFGAFHKENDHSMVSYHTWLLIDAGLVEGKAINFSSKTGKYPTGAVPEGLTWAGHDFLDAARNDTHWNRAKDVVIGATGGLSIELLKVVLKELALESLKKLGFGH